MELEAELASLDLSTCGLTSCVFPSSCEARVPLQGCRGCGGTGAPSPVPWGHGQRWAAQRRGFSPGNSSAVFTAGGPGPPEPAGRGPRMAFTEAWGELRPCQSPAPGEPLRSWCRCHPACILPPSRLAGCIPAFSCPSCLGLGLSKAANWHLSVYSLDLFFSGPWQLDLWLRLAPALWLSACGALFAVASL